MSAVLYVEPDDALRNAVGRFLSSDGLRITQASSLRQAESSLNQNRFGAVLIEPRLPDGDGLSLSRRRQRLGDPTPFVALSSLSRAEDALAGYRAGISLYLKKPMAPPEALAHLRAFLRLAGRGEIAYEDVRLDRDASKLIRPDGEVRPLASQELRFLLHLFTGPEPITSRERLISLIWPAGAADNALDVVVYRVREKLGPWDWLVQTVRGQGYRLGKRQLPAPPVSGPRLRANVPASLKRRG